MHIIWLKNCLLLGRSNNAFVYVGCSQILYALIFIALICRLLIYVTHCTISFRLTDYSTVFHNNIQISFTQKDSYLTYNNKETIDLYGNMVNPYPH